MSDRPTGQRYAIGPESRPTFAHYARLHRDQARERTVILGPERAYEVDAIGLAVLGLCDGRRSLAEIAAHLAQSYSAPVEIIARDVGVLLQGLADKHLLRDGVDQSPAASRPPTAYARFAGGPAGML